MCRVAIIAALEREISPLVAQAKRIEREHQGRKFIFFQRDDVVLVCGGIGVEAARRAAEAVIVLYQPEVLQSVGFAGALQSDLHVGDIFVPALVIDTRDGSRMQTANGSGVLLTFTSVADAKQKASLAKAYGAQAVDMEAAAVAAAARAHGIAFFVVKAISDEVNFDMPETARFVDSQGRFHTASFAMYAAVRPWLWSRIARLARNGRKAAKALAEYLNDPRPSLKPVAAKSR
jgi:adenosylhomocysteine nucleosidase